MARPHRRAAVTTRTSEKHRAGNRVDVIHLTHRRLGMKASLLRRASVLAVPAVTCAWSQLVLAQAPPPPAAPAAPAAAPAPAAAAPAAPAAPAAKWYDAAKIEGFVDAYSSWNFNFPKPQFGSNNGRAFDVSNGF